MNFVHVSVALALGATMFGAAGLVLRAANRRIRLLALSLSLLTLCQTAAVSSRVTGWDMPEIERALDVLELTSGVLALALVHLLNRENNDRRQTDERLRVLEPLNVSNSLLRLAGPTGMGNRPQEKRKALRFTLHARITLRPLDGDGAGVHCEVRDISSSGIGLMSAEPIEVNSAVQFDLAGQIHCAKVTRCQPAGAEFSIGLNFHTELSREQVASIIRSAYVGAVAGRV